MERRHLPLTTQRFLRYVEVPTQIDEKALAAGQHPSCQGQIDLAMMVRDDFQAIADEVGTQYQTELTTQGVLFIDILATPGFEHCPHIGLAAHFDQYANGVPQVRPLVHVYEGGDIVLPERGTVILAEKLKKHLGHRIITSSGDSVLGADDKSGLAVIMETMATILGDHVPHGPIMLIFFPDEEAGELNISNFPPERMNKLNVLYTVDGGEFGVVDTGCYAGRQVTQTFRAEDLSPKIGYKFKVTFEGNDAHPGPYGNEIIPAHLIACYYAVMLEQFCAQNHYYLRLDEVNGGAGTAEIIFYVAIPQDISYETLRDDLWQRTQELQESRKAKNFTLECVEDCSVQMDKAPVQLTRSAISLACENAVIMSDSFHTPWDKDPQDGYVYCRKVEMKDGVAVLTIIPRSFDDAQSRSYVAELREQFDTLTRAFDHIESTFDVREQYVTTSKAIKAHLWSVNLLRLSAKRCGFEVREEQITGGTDGAMMNMHYPDLPCPNIGVGAHDFHKLGEFQSVEDLEAGTNWLVQSVIAATQLTKH
jgi:di/tripeptidase